MTNSSSPGRVIRLLERVVAESPLPEKDKAQLYERLRETIRYTNYPAAEAVAGDGTVEAQLLYNLLPVVPEHLLQEAVSITAEINNPSERARLQEALYGRTRDRQLLSAPVFTTLEIGNEEELISTWQQVIVMLPETLLSEAFSAAAEMEDERRRALLIIISAPHLTESLLGSALTATLGLSSERYRAKTLLGLIPYLKADLKDEALNGARRIKDPNLRLSVLEQLIPGSQEVLSEKKKIQEEEAARIQVDRGSLRPLRPARHIELSIARDALRAPNKT